MYWLMRLFGSSACAEPAINKRQASQQLKAPAIAERFRSNRSGFWREAFFAMCRSKRALTVLHPIQGRLNGNAANAKSEAALAGG